MLSDKDARDATANDAEVSTHKSGENCSEKAAEDEEFSNLNEVNSAKIEVAVDDETMAEHLDIAEESVVEDNEKNYESTVIKMEINIPSKVETLARKGLINDNKSGIFTRKESMQAFF
ncbi:hypothetical protein MPTK1_3g14490 [Marchantia polymorpha subsp. ruderalis]|uniref:Uncharacterized protein n=2 Tax=Marchantia polymorpha TaxID=3197 RepID=A0AAF6B0R9_MARPO|nr:hypothetical protein MARPO_0004s0222 [Marchantia polymorpha]BBN05603.1 hypothetical protein Mp_3g14490 [Marchantia polymorpha subsp. ruderalis]|eukprot:PTQ48979.1 hypothetical protein MARPO_0004s0222 [Marchantia polymorpha]